MLILAKAMLALMIGFILAIIAGVILIPLFKKYKNKQVLSEYLKKEHKKKEGTPTMGGFIFIIPTILTIVILLITNKIEFSTNLGIILFVFIAKDDGAISNCVSLLFPFLKKWIRTRNIYPYP